MTTGIFGTGVSALNSAQMGLSTAEHNIANLNTPGYTRQQTVQAAKQPNFTGSGYIGQGVDVSTVKRVYSDFLGRQILQEQGLSSQLDAHYAQIRQIDNMLADPSSGMAPVMQDFFSAVNNVANAPESQPARQAMINDANAMAARFQSINQRLVDLNEGVNSQIGNSITNINSYAKQISSLNTNISVALNAGQPPNDLLDQRDHLVNELNKEIRTSVVKQRDGSYSVFVGNGQSLVVGSQVLSLKAVLSPGDPSKLDVAYVNSNGSMTTIQQNSLNGGTLGGLLAFRDKTLTNTQNALGRVAMGLAGTFNEQHKLGQDFNGDLGTDFFNKPVPLVLDNRANKGNAKLTAEVVAAADYTALSGSDYELKFNGGSSYTLTRMSDGKVTNFTDGLPQKPVDGLTLSMGEGAEAGDKFTIRPTVNGARDMAAAISDPAKIAASLPVRVQSSVKNLGSGKVSDVTVNAQPGDEVDPSHPVTNVNLQQPVTIVFNDPPTSYRVSGVGTKPANKADGSTSEFGIDNSVPDSPTLTSGTDEAPQDIPYVPGQEISYNGWTVKISGAPAAGDVFTVGKNLNATADNRNGLLLANLQTANTMAGGSTSYQGAYSQIVGDIGNKTRELEVTSKAQSAMVDQTVQTQQALSGVNMDEEAANLMRYQRAYQAAGKALQVANTMFDTILSIGGR
jgi:flagellar hook-associated protein 1 FlgK